MRQTEGDDPKSLHIRCIYIYFVILSLDGKQCRKCFRTVAAIKRFTDKLMWDLKALLYFQLSTGTVFSALVVVCVIGICLISMQ